MEIVQIVGIGIVATILTVLLRQANRPEFALIISAITGLIIFSMLIDKIKYIIDTLSNLSRNANI